MNTDKDKKVDLLFEDLTYKIIGAAIEAHKVSSGIALQLWEFHVAKSEAYRVIHASGVAIPLRRDGNASVLIGAPSVVKLLSSYNCSL